MKGEPEGAAKELAKRLDRVLASNFTNARQTAEYHARYLEASNLLERRELQPTAPDEERG
ncbi:hypothetical protein ACQP1W_48675 [Spirillospora sp. CA-255316]